MSSSSSGAGGAGAGGKKGSKAQAEADAKAANESLKQRLIELMDLVKQAEGKPESRDHAVLREWIAELESINGIIKEDESLRKFTKTVKDLVLRVHNMLSGIGEAQSKALVGRGNLVSLPKSVDHIS
jgi:hypothetical protein